MSNKYPHLQHVKLDSGELCALFETSLVGRRIVKIDGETIELDNGYVIKITPNCGCTCGKGDSFIDLITEQDEPLDAAVMNVEYEEVWDYERFDSPGFKIFILTKNNRICLEGNDATDGEPYYGSGFWVRATMPEHRLREAVEPR